MKKMKVLLIILITVSISFWSCQNEQSIVEPASFSTSSILNKVDFSAVLHIEIVDGLSSDFTYNVNLHNVTNQWVEDEVTWNNRDENTAWDKVGGDYDESSVVQVEVTTNKSLKIDITELFENGVPEYGLLMKVADVDVLPESKRISFYSKESSKPPTLVLKHTVNGKTETFSILADAEILDGTYANTPLGWKDYLYVGRGGEQLELRSVFKFDIPEDIFPEEGTNCTHTKSYWKTHAKGKKKDPAWDLLDNGTKTKFFNSKKNYYNIISRKSWGNPYYVLASEYAAAELNMLSGASPDNITDTFADAAELLSSDPKKLKKQWKDHKFMKNIMTLTADLRAYNIGENGPEHCDDYKWKKDDKKWKKHWKKKWDKKKWDKKKWWKKP